MASKQYAKRGEGNAAIASYVREHYPNVVIEAAEHYDRAQRERVEFMRNRKHQKRVSEIQGKIDALQAELASLNTPKPMQRVEAVA